MTGTTASPAWTDTELDAIGRADELEISSRRPDGTFSPYVTIWQVRAADDVFVRSAHGVGNPWFARAVRRGTGRIRSGGVEREVAFDTDAATMRHTDIDVAYHAKYDRYGARFVAPVTGAAAYAGTLRLVPLA